jgi:response regulator RpfG family c-di-GMP phosphodiesterase
MQAGELYYTTEQEHDNISKGKILLIDDNATDLAARAASLRREGHEVRAYASLPEGLSRVQSEHFDLIMVKLKEARNVDSEEFWSVKSTSAAGSSSSWHAASVGLTTWMWRTWDVRTN